MSVAAIVHARVQLTDEAACGLFTQARHKGVDQRRHPGGEEAERKVQSKPHVLKERLIDSGGMGEKKPVYHLGLHSF